MSLQEAFQKAAEVSLDLVEISPNADPPVCKIMDHGKYIFLASKKKTASKKKQKRTHVKHIRLRPGIEEGDYQVKLRNLMRFLEEGDKVEISLRFRGREMTHKELGMKVLQRVQSDVQDYADIERAPVFEGGKQIIMILVPKKK